MLQWCERNGNDVKILQEAEAVLVRVVQEHPRPEAYMYRNLVSSSMQPEGEPALCVCGPNGGIGGRRKGPPAPRRPGLEPSSIVALSSAHLQRMASHIVPLELPPPPPRLNTSQTKLQA